jgi:hypothetical protein
MLHEISEIFTKFRVGKYRKPHEISCHKVLEIFFVIQFRKYLRNFVSQNLTTTLFDSFYTLIPGPEPLEQEQN